MITIISIIIISLLIIITCANVEPGRNQFGVGTQEHHLLS